MGLLERSKVTLSITCETAICEPGTTIIGSLQAEVHERVSFTALRVRLSGKEHFYVERHGANNTTYTDEKEFLHVEHIQTLLGAPLGTKSSGATELMPGTYAYPFSLYLPPEAPPTFKRKRSNYGCSVDYKIKGILDIPKGFDGKVEYFFVVTQAVSLAQLQPARQNLKVLPTSEASIAKCQCCVCCCCCVDKESHLYTEAALAPEIVVMHSALQLPEVAAVALRPDKLASGEVAPTCSRPLPVNADLRCATLRLRVTNSTKDKTPDRCRVKLIQRHNFPNDPGILYHNTFPFVTLDVRFPGGPLYFGASTMVDVPFCVDGTAPDLSSDERLLPTISVKYFCTTTELHVTFPDIPAKGTMNVANAILLADDVDMTNPRLEMPYEYSAKLRVGVDEIASE